MVAVSHALRPLALALLSWACTGPSVAQPAAPAPAAPATAPTTPPAAPSPAIPSEAAVPTPPALPADALIQLVDLRTGQIHRVDQDGTYRVGAADALAVRPPMSRLERGSQAVSPRGRKRLLEAARAAGFFDLPAQVPGAMPEPVRVPGGSTPIAPGPIALSVRDGARQATVVVPAHLRYLPGFGPLEALVRALDEEALGGWAQE